MLGVFGHLRTGENVALTGLFLGCRVIGGKGFVFLYYEGTAMNPRMITYVQTIGTLCVDQGAVECRAPLPRNPMIRKCPCGKSLCSYNKRKKCSTCLRRERESKYDKLQQELLCEE